MRTAAQVAGGHREIARRYAWQAKEKSKRSRNNPARNMTMFRLASLEKLYAYRCGWTLPDDDAGRDDLLIAAHHIAHLGGDIRQHVIAWARVWAPWMEPAEIEDLATEVIARPRKWTAASLGWRLGLTDAERTALKIVCIRAIDVSDADMKARRRAKQAQRMRNLRARRSTGKARGRPTKNACAVGTASITAHAIISAPAPQRTPQRSCRVERPAGHPKKVRTSHATPCQPRRRRCPSASKTVVGLGQIILPSQAVMIEMARMMALLAPPRWAS
jgi:hypothetical protein